jgi:hypothetical protein
MNKEAISLILSVFLTSSVAFSEDSTPAKEKKSSLPSTNIYEQESSTDSFSDTVVLVREMAGEGQVKFETHPGIYRLPEGDTKNYNLFSKYAGKPVKVNITFDKETKIIQSATAEGI